MIFTSCSFFQYFSSESYQYFNPSSICQYNWSISLPLNFTTIWKSNRAYSWPCKFLIQNHFLWPFSYFSKIFVSFNIPLHYCFILLKSVLSFSCTLLNCLHLVKYPLVFRAVNLWKVSLIILFLKLFFLFCCPL